MIYFFCRTQCGRPPRRELDIIFRHSVKGGGGISNQDNREFHPQAVVGSWQCDHLQVIFAGSEKSFLLHHIIQCSMVGVEIHGL